MRELSTSSGLQTYRVSHYFSAHEVPYIGQYMHLLRDTCIISYIILLNPAVSGGGVVIRNIDEELDIELVTFKHAT